MLLSGQGPNLSTTTAPQMGHRRISPCLVCMLQSTRVSGSSGFTSATADRSAGRAVLRLLVTSASSVRPGRPHAFQRGRHPPRDARVVEQLMENERLVVGPVVVIQGR